MENNEFRTSYSKMDTYKECPQKYKYYYLDGLEYKYKKRSLYVGSHIHKLIELFYAQRNPEIIKARKEAYETFMNTEYVCANPSIDVHAKADELLGDTYTWRDYLRTYIKHEYEELTDEDQAEVGLNYIEDLAKIMAQYEYYYSNDKLQILDLEHNKKCPLGAYNNKNVTLTYICDGIVRLPNGKDYILEHKSYKTDPLTFEQTWLNTQTAIYVSALRNEGNNVEGVLWDNIKSTAPKKPNILKSGAYGKQDSNVTLFSFIDYDTIMMGPDAVVQAIASLPKEVVDLGVQENYNNFLSRHITIFNEQAVDSILADTQAVLEEITGTPRIFRNMGWTCNGCAFKELCQAEMLGQDTSTILSTMFNKKG